MGEHLKENKGNKRFDFREFAKQNDSSVLPDWQNILKNHADLVIYLIESGVDEHKETVEKRIKCVLATNAEGQLVAFDEKGNNKFILEGRIVEVPAETMEILNEPANPPVTGLGRK